MRTPSGAARWAAFGRLVTQGIRGVRAACPSAKVAIHTDLGNHICNPKDGGCDRGTEAVVGWYTSLERALRVDPGGAATFDLLGLSTYPKWSGGTVLRSVARMAALAAASPVPSKVNPNWAQSNEGSPCRPRTYPTAAVSNTRTLSRSFVSSIHIARRP